MVTFVHRQAGLRSIARFARGGIDDPSHAGMRLASQRLIVPSTLLRASN